MKINFKDVLIIGLSCLCGYVCRDTIDKRKQLKKYEEMVDKSTKQTEETIKLAKYFKNENAK